MALSAGERLGPYEILAPIGAGGMGEVYRARDSKLKRDVALKVLPDAFAGDPDRMARFQREAEVLASLNHPHIAHIYGVEDRAIVMELVEGRTLQVPLPVETALLYARQIAEALEYAHERGVIHRDLKPANIKVTVDDTVKLLDFGLAKAVEDPAISGDDPSNSPTLTLGATRLGVILGTAAYMSPEQAAGKVVDRRADIWSFGAVLFEMLSGKQAFRGENASDTLATVMKLDPDWNALPKDTPPSIVKLIRRCLTKDRKQRLQAIGEARIALESPSEPAPTDLRSRSRFGWVVAGVLGLALLTLGGWAVAHFRQPPTEERVLRLQIEPPDGAEFGYGPLSAGLSLSPNGKTAAYVAFSNGHSRLWVRPLDQTTARLISGAEGAGFSFWSPDSKSIAFGAGGKLQRADLAGGAPQTICVASQVLGGAWNSDGRIIFATLTGLFQVPASGGTPVPLIPDASRGNVLWPQMLPGGRFLYFAFGDKPENHGVYAASLAKPSDRVKLLSTETTALYAPGGNGKSYLLWVRGSTLVAQELDVTRLRLLGEPQPVADPVARGVGGQMNAAVSSNGLLLYSAANSLSQFMWLDRTGKKLAVVGQPLDLGPYRLSPDGKRLATTRVSGYGTDLWLMDVERGVPSRFTFDSQSSAPLWSPDGRTIVYRHLSPPGLFRKASNNSGGEQPAFSLPDNLLMPTDWSRDRRFLLYSYVRAQSDIWVLPLTPEGRPVANDQPRRYTGGPFNIWWSRFSPDTRWVAYQSDESGGTEIYIDSFPETHGKVQISTAGGTFPEWGPGGRELFYVSPGNQLMAVSLKVVGDSMEPSAPRELFPLPIVDAGVSPYEVGPEGQRFLVPGSAQHAAQPLTVIVNWPVVLKNGATVP